MSLGKGNRLAWILGIAFSFTGLTHLLPLPALAQQNSTARRSVDWPVYGGGPASDHYSPLAQINPKNVSRLKIAWTFDAGEEGGLETTPIIIDRVLYACTATQKVVALNAATGKLIWKFDSGVSSKIPIRGLSYWADAKDRRIFAAVTNFLYALDAQTGKPIPTFGENGRVDLRKDLRGDYRLQAVAMTSPGVIYKDLIIVGGRNSETHPAPPGDIRAFDVRTGELRWRFHTIPHSGEFGYETWPKDAWTYSGAANNWAGMSLDVERGIVYVPTGSPVFDFYGADRVGDNLFANSLIALDAQTGKRIWHFQGVHHDIWDRDFPSPPTLVTVTRDGKRVDAVAQTSKQGYLFLFDRTNGTPLFPIEERSVAASKVPGEVTAPTQPVPTAPEPFARQLLTPDLLTERTPAAHAWALKEFNTYLSGSQFTPTALDEETVVFPCFLGGAEWGGSAADPKRGILFVNSNEAECVIALTENRPARSTGERTYHNQCSVCHNDDRKGSPPTYPSLADVTKRLSHAEIETTVQQGRGRMPGFPNLQGDYLKALLDYLDTSPDATPQAGQDKANDGELGSGASVDPDSDAPGAGIYSAKCAPCHGPDRRGNGKAIPSLIDISKRFATDQIQTRINNGSGRMPAFPELTGESLEKLLAFLSVNPDPDHDAIYSSNGDGSVMKYRITGSRDFLDPEGYPAIAPPWGTLNAIDLNTGKYLWKIPLGEYPALVAQGITNTGSENYGGPILTASDVLFIGATIFDRKARAFDARNGKLLWQKTLPHAAVATPATYMIDGKQYVVFAAGGGKDPKGSSGSVYVAFTLP
jgi:glucose dehydrogenase